MKKTELIVCSTILAVILWVIPAMAFDMPERGRWWHNQHMITMLNLSQEQSNQIDKIFVRHRKEFIELSSVLRQRYLALEEFLETRGVYEIDRGRLMEMVSAVQEARTKLEQSRLLMLLEIKKTLSSEQTRTLNRIRREMMSHMREMGMSPGGRMGGKGARER